MAVKKDICFEIDTFSATRIIYAADIAAMHTRAFRPCVTNIYLMNILDLRR
ncbi:MAG: hypothetical protein JW787_12250 [Sedimentisphaerales bacterium]|nr:hypothetical protein [Sedimentisphaerales bacterium]